MPGLPRPLRRGEARRLPAPLPMGSKDCPHVEPGHREGEMGSGLIGFLIVDGAPARSDAGANGERPMEVLRCW